MTKKERTHFINELVSRVKKDLQKESSKYPKEWDGVELRWRIADVFGQVAFGKVGERKGSRYRNYKNVVYTENLI